MLEKIFIALGAVLLLMLASFIAGVLVEKKISNKFADEADKVRSELANLKALYEAAKRQL